MQLSRVIAIAALAAACGGEGSDVPDAAASPDARLLDAPRVPDASPNDAAWPDGPLVDAPPSVCMTEERDDAYVPGLTKVGAAGYSFVLESMIPPPPRKGSSDWVVRLEDPTGAPVDGVTFGVYPFMPDHGHGTGVRAVQTDLGGGRYDLSPVNLFMTGYWTIRVAAKNPDTTTIDQVIFSFCVQTIVD